MLYGEENGKQIIAEVQVVFSQSEPSVNIHTNHKLYEIERCKTLDGLSQAFIRISHSANDSMVVPVPEESNDE
jgi:hypothetical protein